MARLPALALLLALGSSCIGRDHDQADGEYAFTFLERDVIKDTCGSLAKRPVIEGNRRELPRGSLRVLGDTVRLRFELYDITLVGDYHRARGEDGREHFTLDGSTNNVTEIIGGAECLVDVVNIHLEANTVSADEFSATLSVRYDTVQPASCNCEYLLNISAARQGTP